MTRGDISHRWVPIHHLYVPGYKLQRMVDYIAAERAVPGWNGDVVIYQDINRERWLWGFRLRKKRETSVASGHAPTLEGAQEKALAAAKALSPW